MIPPLRCSAASTAAAAETLAAPKGLIADPGPSSEQSDAVVLVA